MPNKKLHADPKSYAPFVALRYNATKATQLFGLVNQALCEKVEKQKKLQADSEMKTALK